MRTVKTFNPETGKVYLVGGGIASLATAAFLIRDGEVSGRNIEILESSGTLGGSLDGAGSPSEGYVIRGGRMFEEKYLCTFDLFSTIPTVEGGHTVTEEIFEFNRSLKTASKSRLMRHGQPQTAPAFGMSEAHILSLERLALEPEGLLGRSRIAEHFDPTFFRTDFWYMWCTTFAFQPWHSAVEFKRYLLRFAHMVSGFNRLRGIMRTVYNQYDSLVRPLQRWLEAHGVAFALNTRVVSLGLDQRGPEGRIDSLLCEYAGERTQITLRASDCVVVTLGSMTDGSDLGAMDAAPRLRGKRDGSSWMLWESLAEGRPEFGQPATFANHIDESKWVSFTATLDDPTLLPRVAPITGNVPGEGGLITFPESGWLASIVIPHQPHFLNQPEHVSVLWGYGLNVDASGDFIQKPMCACTGREILTEVLGHLHLLEDSPAILARAICIPCMMPFITSQFLPRRAGDRPQIVPRGWTNLAFVGQFVEIPDDTVFTVEYSVRSAQTAAYALLGLERLPPPVYKGYENARVLYQALLAMHGLQG